VCPGRQQAVGPRCLERENPLNRLILIAALLQASTPDPLVGRWDTGARSRGGLGTWFTLSSDGRCAETTGAMVDGTWQLIGDQLVRRVPESPDGRIQTDTMAVAISDRTLTMRAGATMRQLMRVGLPAESGPALVGVWSYPHPAGGTAYEDFERDGRYLFRLPISTTSCTWRADQTELQITANRQAQSFKWNLDGTRLTLEHDGARDVFRREATILPVATR